jgi:hypothetical protein
MQAFGQRGSARTGKPRVEGGNQGHDDAPIHAPPQKAHRNRCGATAAMGAAKGKPLPLFLAKNAMGAAGFARITRLMQSPLATAAALSFRLSGKVTIDLKQECKKLGGLKNALAHCKGLLSWSIGDSSDGVLSSRSPRGITFRPSAYLIKNAGNPINKTAQAQLLTPVLHRNASWNSMP